ncbi:MAG TPA: hypothetical protein PLE10_02965 [Brevefilum sp.]|nr:hypothetical protein [Brevefilum sp.]HOR18775.1 hypothetical protein [Brevefilum sp.]HPL68676.1 hypothetical protein [Brevefilum sp.]
MTILEVILIIISIVGFIGALPQIWGSDWRAIYRYQISGIISWDQVNEAYLRVFSLVKEQSFTPSVIVGIGRGGIVAAGLLCSEFINKACIIENTQAEETIPKIKIGVINSIVHYKKFFAPEPNSHGLKSQIEGIELISPELELNKDDKILLVVAQNFIGQSIKDAKNLILSKGIPIENIKTAALVCHEHPNIDVNYHPDFIGFRTKINKTMPWKSKKRNTDRF